MLCDPARSQSARATRAVVGATIDRLQRQGVTGRDRARRRARARRPRRRARRRRRRQDTRHGQGGRPPGRAATGDRPDDRVDRRPDELAGADLRRSRRFLEYRFYGRNPDIVLVDSTIIAQAPVRFLVAGIGDGLSTFFEADAVRPGPQARDGRADRRCWPPPTLARLCYDTLLADGLAERDAVQHGVVTRRRRARRSRPTPCSPGSASSPVASPPRIRSTTA